MEEEIWVDIKGYEGLYQVSNQGRVRSLDREVKHSKGGYKIERGKILKGIISGGGYIAVTLNKDGVPNQFKVHRLVAETFIPNTENKRCVDHIDTDKTNNKVENLRWVTDEENNNNELTKKHMSEARKIYYENNPDARKGENNPMYGKIGENNPNYGRKHTQETKDKISKARKGKYIGINNPNSLRLICEFPDGTQTNIMNRKEMSEYTGLSEPTISNIILNKDGYKPKYKKNYWLKGIKIIKVEESDINGK